MAAEAFSVPAGRGHGQPPAPHRRPLPYRAGDDGTGLPPLRGYDEALAWCEAEQATLLGAVGLAVNHGHDRRGLAAYR